MGLGLCMLCSLVFHFKMKMEGKKEIGLYKKAELGSVLLFISQHFLIKKCFWTKHTQTIFCSIFHHLCLSVFLFAYIYIAFSSFSFLFEVHDLFCLTLCL